jgi:uridine kinase
MSRPNNAKLAEALRHAFQADILPQAVLADAKSKRVRLVVIEGIRRLAELAPLRRMKNFKLMYVTAPIEVRWQRAKSRRTKKRSDDQVSLAEYRRIERKLVTEYEIPRMGKIADIRIDNLGTRAELFRQVDNVIRSLGVRA